MQVNEYSTLGRSGLRVSPLCLGTMTFGTEWGWGAEESVSRSLFDRYVEQGGNFIDTADGYTNGQAAEVWVTTMVATGAAALGWLLVERLRDGHATSLGAASGVVAGLVAITPSCSSVTPLGAIAVGLLAGVFCAMAVGLKFRFGFDDSLDVVGVHLVGGRWGTLAVGLFASAATTAGVDGLFYGGGLDQLWRQAVGAFAVLFYSFVVTLVLGFLVAKTMGFRLSEEDEVEGIDGVEHAESAYDFATSGGGGRSLTGSSLPTAKAQADAEARGVNA